MQVYRGSKRSSGGKFLGVQLGWPSAAFVRKTSGPKNAKVRSRRSLAARRALVLGGVVAISFVLWEQAPRVQALNQQVSKAVKAYFDKSTVNDAPTTVASATAMTDPLLLPALPSEPRPISLVYEPADDQVQRRAARPTASEAVDDESIESADRKIIESLAELIEMLEAGGLNELDLDSINDFVAESAEAFDYISGEYLLASDPALKDKLRIILDNANSPDKVNLAMELAGSDSQQDREIAYSWLLQSEEQDLPQVYNTLIEALEKDENSALYPGLISSLSSYGVTQDAQARDRLLERLESLSLDSQEQTAVAALSKIVEISQGKKTLDLLHAHITSSPLDLQIAAIQELPRIGNPGKELVMELTNIMENPSAPQSLRQASVMSIVAMENQGLAFE